MSVTTRSKAKLGVDAASDPPVHAGNSNRMEKFRYKLLEKVAEGTTVIEKLQVPQQPHLSIFVKFAINC
jgi:hypothetical protein